MALAKKFNEFFGLNPVTDDVAAEQEMSYYDDSRYPSEGSSAYAPRTSYERQYAQPEPAAPAPAPVRSSRPYVPQVAVVEPASFDDAVQIGSPFREGDAVIFELTDFEGAVARRFIDFAAGLCYISYGKMYKLSKGLNTHRVVFALVPEDASIQLEELQQAAGLIR